MAFGTTSVLFIEVSVFQGVPIRGVPLYFSNWENWHLINQVAHMVSGLERFHCTCTDLKWSDNAGLIVNTCAYNAV